jgi:hypothetical protein
MKTRNVKVKNFLDTDLNVGDSLIIAKSKRAANLVVTATKIDGGYDVTLDDDYGVVNTVRLCNAKRLSQVVRAMLWA